ncbi:MAG: hypothetical protein N4A43_00050 [Alphaproteobacteria bacterium]|nr:hypothetical protein [Alphaproteobacteria bacterium]
MLRNISYSSLQYMAISILFLIVSIIPFPFVANIFIPWFIPCFFVWQCKNDYHFPPVFIFFVSLIFDFFSGGLLGSSSLIILFFSRLIYNNRYILRGQTFFIKWITFCIWLLIIYIVDYALVSLIAMKLVEGLTHIMGFILLSLTYPMFYKVFQWIEDHE